MSEANDPADPIPAARIVEPPVARARGPLPDPAPTQGVLPRAQVRLVCFAVLALCLIGAGVICVLAVWGAAPEGASGKAVATLAIVAAVMAGFTTLNELFGRAADS